MDVNGVTRDLFHVEELDPADMLGGRCRVCDLADWHPGGCADLSGRWPFRLDSGWTAAWQLTKTGPNTYDAQEYRGTNPEASGTGTFNVDPGTGIAKLEIAWTKGAYGGYYFWTMVQDCSSGDGYVEHTMGPRNGHVAWGSIQRE
jgi:hypothetical protein